MKGMVDKLSQENRELKEKVGFLFRQEYLTKEDNSFLILLLQLNPILNILTLFIDERDQRPPSMQNRGEQQYKQEVQWAANAADPDHCLLFLTGKLCYRWWGSRVWILLKWSLKLCLENGWVACSSKSYCLCGAWHDGWDAWPIKPTCNERSLRREISLIAIVAAHRHPYIISPLIANSLIVASK